MKVEILALCDFAQNVAGKLTMVGAFDTIFVREFPARHPLMCVAVRMRFPVYELGDHEVKILIRKQDESDLVPPFAGKLSVNGIGNDSAVADLAVHLNGIMFEREETLRVVLSVDDNELSTIPLYIRRAPRPQG